MANKLKYVDLHCHPHIRVFNFLYPEYQNKNPWMITASNFKNQNKAKRAFSYSQGDMVKLWNGNVGVAFASLYPFEKGFFSGGGKVDHKIWEDINNGLDHIPIIGNVLHDVLDWIRQPLFRNEEERRSLKDYFQAILMRMPPRRVKFYQSSNYDYFEELKAEYAFLKSHHNLTGISRVKKNFFKRTFGNVFSPRSPLETVEAEGTYFIAKNHEEIKESLDEGKMILMLTIEGMHAFGMDENMDLETLSSRIKEVKEWEFPVFFITFAHHFNNFLCGHAHSMPNNAKSFVNQEDGLDVEFNELGKKAARLILSIDEDGNMDEMRFGRRILIDVKHMGVSSRMQFYNEIIRPSLTLDQPERIPVIASHVGYAGVDRLTDLLANFRNGLETDDFTVAPNFNHWHINLCNEDLEIIVKSKGLIGICFDQRIMGQSRRGNRDSKELLRSNLEGMVMAVCQSQHLAEIEKPYIWKCLCIGTDFDGYIDPLKNYPTALQFEALEKDLIEIIEKLYNEKKEELYITKDPKELVEDICKENAIQFLKNNFN